MKRILITGRNSYVGTSFSKWISKYPQKYVVHTISLRDQLWREYDFTDYDVIIHAAAIVHIKETRKNKDLYYKVNRDLAYEVALKAKIQGVKQFIFLSSMSVYGINSGIIYEDSPLKPNSTYGKSKLQAEEVISTLEDNLFKVAIIRPPMIYGRGCKGNYYRLARFAMKTPVFPDIDNKRSMIYIDHLSEFIRILIDEYKSGTFYPQNREYVCTSEMVKYIAEIHGRKVIMTKLFNPILRPYKLSMIEKVFGNLVYDMTMSELERTYNIYSFKESIRMTEQN